MKRLFIECNPYFVRVALAEDGELIEFGGTDEVFDAPRDKRTEDYITGRLG